MKFCLDDGSSLVELLAPARLSSGAEATLHMPGPTQPAVSGHPNAQPSTMTSLDFQPAAEVFSSESPTERDSRRSGRGLLWVVIALIIGGSGIAIALIVTRGLSREKVSAPPVASPIPSATQTMSATQSPSPGLTPTKSAATDQSAQVNRSTERPTPPLKPTPSRTAPEGDSVVPRAPRTISGGVLNGKATYLAKPPYPAIARSSNVSGAVQVQVLVDENGNVISAHAISGHPLLQSSAVSAARSSKFAPTKLSGQAVKVSGVIIYNFQAQ